MLFKTFSKNLIGNQTKNGKIKEVNFVIDHWNYG